MAKQDEHVEGISSGDKELDYSQVSLSFWTYPICSEFLPRQQWRTIAQNTSIKITCLLQAIKTRWQINITHFAYNGFVAKMKYVTLQVGKGRQVKIGVIIFLQHIYKHYITQENPIPLFAIEPPPLVSLLREIARERTLVRDVDVEQTS
ncbi:hypothetical protein SELMODRAFT_413153 [Selaginella moellendorffii]|uniref:Uncharacterized protein n=1 Tax=Selaginella moellendorffii TaxID=88036 RepID=D8RNI6_SELML|nr:hypothetical protein SELMODRAFT_413153 [Selaginella moellendorffii]